MKKLLSLILCLILTVSVFGGCSDGGNGETTVPETTAATEPSLSVGFVRVDITPTAPVPLAGWPDANFRISDSVTERLYGTCVAFTDAAGTTVLLYHLDLIGIEGSDMPFIRSAVSKATGVPMDNVIFAATHTHSAPKFTTPDNPAISNYVKALKGWLVDAGKQAMEDRKPAKMYTATAQTEGMNFIRYYLFDNGLVGSGAGIETEGLKRLSHHGEPDRTIQMVKFQRQDAKDVILVNWQGHPSMDGGKTKTNVSADIVGVMRTYVERELNCQFAYFTGASGNVNNSSFVEPHSKDYIEQGEKLGKYAVEAAADFTELPLGSIRLIRRNYDGKDKNIPTQKNTIQITAFAVGDVGFAVAPYEMFDSSGRAIKSGSPFSMTMVVTCANGAYGYIPSEFAYTCFASYEAGSSAFASGTAEELEKEYVSMLTELHK